MTPDQIPALLKQVSYADPRLLPNDKHELMGLAALWATVLADIPADYAMQAVGEHYANSPYPIKPSDIADRWRTQVRDRMRRDTTTFEPNAHPEINPDDETGDAYVAALRADRRAVATGQRPPTPSRAITSGEVQEGDIRAMRQQNDLKTFMRQAITQAATGNAYRRKLVARFPDLDEQVHALFGHAKWSGSVGGNARTAAIVAEAERRAANPQEAVA